jgi:hypothetical protein
VKSDLCPAYAIAVALHPNMKRAYFREEWQQKPEWIARAEATVDSVWKETYRGYSAAHPSPVDAEPAVDDGASANQSSLSK